MSSSLLVSTSFATHTRLRARVSRLVSTSLTALTLCLLAACGDDASSAGPDGPDEVQGTFPKAVPDDCITDVSAGDHTFTCEGITYLLLVDDKCLKSACGLIFDIHGATMSGLQQRDNTLLHKLAPQAGFIYVNPSATPNNTGGTWKLDSDPAKVGQVLLRTIAAFHVDPLRVHVTGFSQGGQTTLDLVGLHNDVIASAAPVAGAIEAVTWATDAWRPRVPLLIMNGIADTAVSIERSRSLVDRLVSGLSLSGGEEVEGDGHFTRKHWVGPSDMELDYIEHDYGGQALLGGHCIPGGVDIDGAANNFGLNATTCTTGDIKLNWGEVVLKFFIEHPRKPAAQSAP